MQNESYCSKCQAITPHYVSGRRRCIVCARAYVAAWYADHSGDKSAYYAAWYAEHDRSASKAAWHAANMDKACTYRMNRRALKRNATMGPIDVGQVFANYGGICYLCGLVIDISLKYPDPMSKSVDHIEPLARGGSHTMRNLAPTHLHCNLAKGAR